MSMFRVGLEDTPYRYDYVGLMLKWLIIYICMYTACHLSSFVLSTIMSPQFHSLYLFNENKNKFWARNNWWRNTLPSFHFNKQYNIFWKSKNNKAQKNIYLIYDGISAMPNELLSFLIMIKTYVKLHYHNRKQFLTL